MAILKIARMGHPVLARVADPVTEPSDPRIAKLVDDMMETLADAGGIGLAAPQIHVPLRIVIYRVPAGRMPGGVEVPLTVLINPRLAPVGEARESDWEGCLSVPGMTGRVARWARLRFTARDLKGGTVEGEADGFHARVLQHECDHLDGILYPMRIDSLRDFGFNEEILRRREQEEA